MKKFQIFWSLLKLLKLILFIGGVSPRTPPQNFETIFSLFFAGMCVKKILQI